MATVHHGLLRGEAGFSRTVAIKRLHAQHAKDEEFSQMFRDEARLAARIRHPHVVTTLDVAMLDGELLLVLEYVHGESLGRLMQAARRSDEAAIPRDVVSAIVCGALHGLQAAHEATDESGVPLRIVHRDVSPPNILVGVDGVPRVLDFGIAKAIGRLQTTRNGDLKGKLAYMSPEQLSHHPVDRRTDIYAIGVVLWEVLTLQRLFLADTDAALIARMLEHRIDPPSALAANVSSQVDAIVMRALARDPAERFQTAREMALALEGTLPMASATRVAAWVEGLAGQALAERQRAIAKAEGAARSLQIDDDRLGITPLQGTRRVDVAPDFPDTTVSATSGITGPVLTHARGRAWALLAAAFLLVLVVGGLAGVWLLRRSSLAVTSASAPTTPIPSAAEVISEAPVNVAPAISGSGSGAATGASSLAAPPPTRTSPRQAGRPKTPAPSQPPPAKSGQHCEWHVEDGIWVPVCR
jgi:serine/threonine-protein kinase